jgi:Phage major capsid protein E
MEVNALRGIVKDGAGTTLYDYFSEFGLAQQAVDFVLGTAGTQVQAKVREVLRKIETELKGETMSEVLALVSPEFFDKLIGHTSVEDAYKYFSSTGAQPLREDTRRRFPFAGIVFEEDNATVTLSTGSTKTLCPPAKAYRLPGWHPRHLCHLRRTGQPDRDGQHHRPADVRPPAGPSGRQRHRGEDRGLDPAGQQAPAPGGEDPQQQLNSVARRPAIAGLDVPPLHRRPGDAVRGLLERGAGTALAGRSVFLVGAVVRCEEDLLRMRRQVIADPRRQIVGRSVGHVRLLREARSFYFAWQEDACRWPSWPQRTDCAAVNVWHGAACVDGAQQVEWISAPTRSVSRSRL